MPCFYILKTFSSTLNSRIGEFVFWCHEQVTSYICNYTDEKAWSNKKYPFKDGDALFALINNENSTVEAESSIISNNSIVDNIIDVNSSATSNADDTKGAILSSLVIKIHIIREGVKNVCEIFTILSYVVPVKSKVKISQNCVVFSEYMNLKEILIFFSILN